MANSSPPSLEVVEVQHQQRPARTVPAAVVEVLP
jgi:hypothetical protein